MIRIYTKEKKESEKKKFKKERRVKEIHIFMEGDNLGLMECLGILGVHTAQ